MTLKVVWELFFLSILSFLELSCSKIPYSGNYNLVGSFFGPHSLVLHVLGLVLHVLNPVEGFQSSPSRVVCESRLLRSYEDFSLIENSEIKNTLLRPLKNVMILILIIFNVRILDMINV